ncbi:MAG: hypothetical protein EBS06_00350 [Proteobacteria bacterium]|nr:hypothetical protein [Pseudomonadota bacterium]
MKKANFFNRHLIESDENYFEHFLFAFATAMWILFVGMVLTCHAICPFIFKFTASSNIKKINEVMQKRREKLMSKIAANASQSNLDKEDEGE